MDLRDLFPGPRAYFIFAAVLALCFIIGLKKKPERNEDGAWMWWLAMTVFLGCIVFFVLKALAIL